MKHKMRQLLLVGFLAGCATSSVSLDNSYFFPHNADMMLQLEVRDLHKPLKKAIREELKPQTQRIIRYTLSSTRRVSLYSHNRALQLWLQGRYPASWIKKALKQDEGWHALSDEVFAHEGGVGQLMVAKNGRQIFASGDDVQRLISTPAPPLTEVVAPVVAQAFATHRGLTLFMRDSGVIVNALNLPFSPGPILITAQPVSRLYRFEVRFLSTQLQQLRLVSVAIQASGGMLVERFPSHTNMLSDFDLELDDDGLVWRMHATEAELSDLLAALLGWLDLS